MKTRIGIWGLGLSVCLCLCFFFCFFLAACTGIGDGSDAVVKEEAAFTTGAGCSTRGNCPSLPHTTASCRSGRCDYTCASRVRSLRGQRDPRL